MVITDHNLLAPLQSLYIDGSSKMPTLMSLSPLVYLHAIGQSRDLKWEETTQIMLVFDFDYLMPCVKCNIELLHKTTDKSYFRTFNS